MLNGDISVTFIISAEILNMNCYRAYKKRWINLICTGIDSEQANVFPAENAFHEMTIHACQLVKGTYMCTAVESATPKIHQLFNSNFLPSGNLRFPLLLPPRSGCWGGGGWIIRVVPYCYSSLLPSIQDRIQDTHSPLVNLWLPTEKHTRLLSFVLKISRCVAWS